jgi:hypothetical protein
LAAQTSAQEVASEPEVAGTTEEQPVEEAASETTEAEPETTDTVQAVEPAIEPEAQPAE